MPIKILKSASWPITYLSSLLVPGSDWPDRSIAFDFKKTILTLLVEWSNLLARQHTPHTLIWVRYFGAKQIFPNLVYVERRDLFGGIFLRHQAPWGGSPPSHPQGLDSYLHHTCLIPNICRGEALVRFRVCHDIYNIWIFIRLMDLWYVHTWDKMRMTGDLRNRWTTPINIYWTQVQTSVYKIYKNSTRCAHSGPLQTVEEETSSYWTFGSTKAINDRFMYIVAPFPKYSIVMRLQ